MNKEEILEKARLEKDDELINHINNKALLLIVMLTVFLTVSTAVRKVLGGEPAAEYFVIANAPLAAGFLYRFLKTKKNINPVLFFITLALTVLGIVGMALGY